MILLILFIIGVALWVIGGQFGGRIRDIPCPIILGIMTGIRLFHIGNISLLWAFLTIASAQIIRMGYGNYEDGEENSTIAEVLALLGYKDYNGWYVRGIWGLLVGLVTPLFLIKYIGFYILYVFINGLISFLVSRLKLSVIPTDILVASAFFSLVFMI